MKTLHLKFESRDVYLVRVGVPDDIQLNTEAEVKALIGAHNLDRDEFMMIDEGGMRVMGAHFGGVGDLVGCWFSGVKDGDEVDVILPGAEPARHPALLTDEESEALKGQLRVVLAPSMDETWQIEMYDPTEDAGCGNYYTAVGVVARNAILRFEGETVLHRACRKALALLNIPVSFYED